MLETLRLKPQVESSNRQMLPSLPGQSLPVFFSGNFYGRT